MSIADKKYKELIEDIYENGVWDTDSNVRTVYPDGSPAYTKSIFGKQVVFEEGEIPLLTSKFVGWRTAFKEMRLFWILQTVKKEDFEKENVKVWDEWFLKDNTLGKSYAYQFESRPKKEVVKVKKRILNKPSLEKIKVKELLEPNKNSKNSLIGKKFKNEYGEYIVLDVFPSGTHYKKSQSVKVQFLETGYTTIRQMSNISDNIVKDAYFRNVCNIAYGGECNNVKGYSEKQIKNLRDKWNRMIHRCYDKNNDHYHNYGGKGVFVSNDFLSFEQFLVSIRKLPNFFIAKIDDFEGWSLDKDYYGGNCYSKQTCVWLSEQENKLYRNHIKPIQVTFHDSSVKIYLCIKDIAEEIGVGTSTVHRWLDGTNTTYEKYNLLKINYITNDKEYVYRYKLSSNQVVDLLHNIKNNSTSRRLMTSFWNDADTSDKALQECAMQTTWNVRNGKLDLLLYSRSVDTALGLPFNWIQYWFLLQLVAKSTGLKAGRFIHQMGNVHYYCRHEKTLLEQINSETHDSPTFEFTSDNTEFFNFTVDDIKVTNYKHNGKFSYEIAI